MASEQISPKYKYYAYQDRQFASMDELNKLEATILQPGSWWQKLINLFQVLAAVAIMWIRDRVQGRAMELEKQGYMIRRAQANDEELARDPLDVERRPTS